MIPWKNMPFYLIAGSAALVFVWAGLWHVGVAIAMLSFLDLLIPFTWLVFITSLIIALLVILLGFVLFLPLQLSPSTFRLRYDPKLDRQLKVWLTTIAVVLLVVYPLLSWAPLVLVLGFGAMFGYLVLSLLERALSWRDFVSKYILSNLLLPAISLSTMNIAIPNTNQKVNAADMIQEIRSNLFVDQAQQHQLQHQNQQKPLWCNVTLPGDGDVCIDAAYWINPNQANRDSSEQAWILCFNANGELYEFSLTENLEFGLEVGANVFVFNYRGVSRSKGTISKSSDLVADGKLCVSYLRDSLGARSSNILFFGRSLGGGVAALLRSIDSPQGPIISDRSFRSLASAAQSVISLGVQSYLNFKFSIPVIVIRGVSASLIRLDMDVVPAWEEISGPKMIIYHLQDQMISYSTSSLHEALEAQHCGVVIRLETIEKCDYHNAALTKFPQYSQIIATCRSMLPCLDLS